MLFAGIVPLDKVYRGCELGKWVGEQLDKYKAGKLDPQKQRSLEQIGYERRFEKLDQTRAHQQTKWNNMFGLLVVYKQINGNCKSVGKGEYRHVVYGKVMLISPDLHAI